MQELSAMDKKRLFVGWLCHDAAVRNARRTFTLPKCFPLYRAHTHVVFIPLLLDSSSPMINAHFRRASDPFTQPLTFLNITNDFIYVYYVFESAIIIYLS